MCACRIVVNCDEAEFERGHDRVSKSCKGSSRRSEPLSIAWKQRGQDAEQCRGVEDRAFEG